MRKVRSVTAEEENFRTEPFVGNNMRIVRRDFVKPEPEGTIILMAFKITGYDQDCDGSAMARLDNIDFNGDATGATLTHYGLYPESDLVVTLDELKSLIKGVSK